jgi:ribosomal protein S14
MKRLVSKDKNRRFFISNFIKQYYCLLVILKNKNISILLRQNVFLQLKKLSVFFSIIKLSNRCVLSFNKKRFNKITFCNRIIFLKQIQNGQVYGFKKSSW